MKASRGQKRRVLKLPQDFQETLISHELKFEKNEIDIDLIRKLIYLFSVNGDLIAARNGV